MTATTRQGTLATALRIEARKLLTTRTGYLVGALAVALGAVITILTVTGASSSAHTALDVFTGALTGGVQTSYMLTAVVGITAVAGEYRHRTATPSYLAIPRRGTVIAAKLIALLGYGLAAGVVVIGVCSAIAAPWLAHRHLLNGALTPAGVARAVVGGTLAIAIMTVLGVALAALVHNQLAAVAGLLVYLFALEPSINNLAATRAAYPYLPGGAVQALVYSGHRAFGSDTGAQLLHPAVGGLVLAGYAAAITAVATWTSIRRDIT